MDPEAACFELDAKSGFRGRKKSAKLWKINSGAFVEPASSSRELARSYDNNPFGRDFQT